MKKLSEFLQLVNPDMEVSVCMNTSLWHEDCELVYHSSYLGKANAVPDTYLKCNVLKTFTAFMWGTLTIIIENPEEV